LSPAAAHIANGRFNLPRAGLIRLSAVSQAAKGGGATITGAGSAKPITSTLRSCGIAAESGGKDIPVIRKPTGKTIPRPPLATGSNNSNGIRNGASVFL